MTKFELWVELRKSLNKAATKKGLLLIPEERSLHAFDDLVEIIMGEFDKEFWGEVCMYPQNLADADTVVADEDAAGWWRNRVADKYLPAIKKGEEE